jgi:hypothetical protein
VKISGRYIRIPQKVAFLPQNKNDKPVKIKGSQHANLSKKNKTSIEQSCNWGFDVNNLTP